MKNKNRKFTFTVGTMAMMALSTACGPKGVLEGNPGVSGPASNVNTSVNSVTPGLTPSSSTSTSISVNSNLLPAITPPAFDLRGWGTSTNLTGTQVTYDKISTDTTLKVTLVPDSSGYMDTSNQTVGFNCIKFNVTVKPQGSTSAGWSKPILVSTNGKAGSGYCQGAQVQPTLDFSEYMTSGHGQMEVMVSLDKSANSDNCRKYYWNTATKKWNYGSPSYYETYYGLVIYGVGYGGCPLDVFYEAYHVTGNVQIHVDGTS